jgi:hypothetical protein
VIAKTFGNAWGATHIANPEDQDASGYLKLDFSGDKPRETKSLRMAHLAEMIVNLQGIPGFEHPIAQMKAEQIESGYAELEFGKLLYINDIDFCFVDPKNRKKGEAFDFELTLSDGLKVCADAKCKIESGAPSISSIRNSLDIARRQLPAGRPGIIFMKLPEHWSEHSEIHAKLTSETRRFLGGTQRIVSVKHYISRFIFEDRSIVNMHRYFEISNPNNRFDPTRDWSMFRTGGETGSWNGLPPKWIRLINFAQGASHA